MNPFPAIKNAVQATTSGLTVEELTKTFRRLEAEKPQPDLYEDSPAMRKALGIDTEGAMLPTGPQNYIGWTATGRKTHRAHLVSLAWEWQALCLNHRLVSVVGIGVLFEDEFVLCKLCFPPDQEVL